MRSSLAPTALIVAWGVGVLGACGDDADDPGGPSPLDETDAVDTEPPGDSDTAPPVEAPRPSYVPTDAVGWLVRASLDLRGVRPSLEELAAVEADPDAVEGLVVGFVDDPRFGDRVAELFAEVYLTRDEDPFVRLETYEGRWSLEDLARSTGAEPLQVLARIAREDRSYAEVVTADWTMANEVTGDIWPVDYPEGATGWQVVRYTDGRPSVGLLASNGLWWKYGSMENNLNRGRGNQFSRLFLCADFLAAEIDFSTDQPLSSEEALGDAIRTDPKCAACHDALDPLASHFFGFWYFGPRKATRIDHARYHPQRERAWRDYDGLPPAYRGQPTSGLADLGARVVDDPRFSRCFVERSFDLLLRRARLEDERVILDELTEAFLAEGMRVGALYRALVRHEAYRHGEGDGRLKLVSPAVLSTQLEDLTGFRLSRDDWDLVTAPVLGLQGLAGGIDGRTRTERLDEPSTTQALVVQRLAESAALHVVGHDLATPAEARLLTRVAGVEAADDALVAEQIAELHARILSVRVAADDPEVLALVDVLRAFEASHDDATAWVAVVTILLRDPRFLVYG